MQFFLSQYGRTLSCNAVEKIYVNTMTAYISSARYYNYFFFVPLLIFFLTFFSTKTKKKCHFLFTSFAVAKFPRSALMVDHIQHCIITYIILKALSFYWSKMILDHPNCFGRMQIVLVGSELFWLDLNNFGQVPIILFWTKFIIRTCPK